jgi:hypothetical protein
MHIMGGNGPSKHRFVVRRQNIDAYKSHQSPICGEKTQH